MTDKAPFTPLPESHEARLRRLEEEKAARNQRAKKKSNSRSSKHGKASTEDRLADALLAARRDRAAEGGQDPALADFREDLFAELRKLIPTAIQQARKGKPALLRILTRYTR